MLESFEEQKCSILGKAKPKREFDWLVPTFGLLHFEMNAARSSLKLNWEVFVKEFGCEDGLFI